MMKQRLTFAALLVSTALSSAAVAQNQPLFATGPLTPGHALVLQQTGTPGSAVTRDGGPALAGNFTELGITNDGLPLCVRDKAAQHLLCLGANALGGGMISYNPLGTGAPLGLTINLNGVNFPFPGTGTGNVVGPTSPPATATHIAVWNGGTALTDPVLQPPAFTNTQMNEYAASLVNGLSPATEFAFYTAGSPGQHATDALFGGVAVPNTATVYQADGVAGYINTASTTTNAVGGFFAARALATGAKIWALNTIAADGGFAVTNAGFEADTNCNNASSTCNGITVIGASTAQFTGNGLSISSPSVQSIGLVKWSNGIVVSDGCCLAGMILGASANTGNNVTSQALFLGYRNGSGSPFDYEFQVNPGQTLAITNSAGAGTANAIVDGTIAISAPLANQASLSFITVSTTKFQLLRDSSNNFIGFDNSNNKIWLEVQPSGNMILGETGELLAFAGTLQFSASTTGAVTPAFTNAPTGCSTVQWIGPVQIASPALTQVYIPSCHS